MVMGTPSLRGWRGRAGRRPPPPPRGGGGGGGPGVGAAPGAARPRHPPPAAGVGGTRGPSPASIARVREEEYAPGLRAGHGAVLTPPRARRAMEAVMDVAIPTAKPVPARSPGSPGRVAALAAVLAW